VTLRFESRASRETSSFKQQAGITAGDDWPSGAFQPLPTLRSRSVASFYFLSETTRVARDSETSRQEFAQANVRIGKPPSMNALVLFPGKSHNQSPTDPKGRPRYFREGLPRDSIRTHLSPDVSTSVLTFFRHILTHHSSFREFQIPAGRLCGASFPLPPPILLAKDDRYHPEIGKHRQARRFDRRRHGYSDREDCRLNNSISFA